MKIVLVGDAWVGGKRDRVGLALPLAAKFAENGRPLPVVDLTGEGGLPEAARRVSTAGLEGPALSIVVLGVEDAARNITASVWEHAYLGLAQLLVALGPVVLVAPPPSRSDLAVVPHFNKEARRWIKRVPTQAIEKIKTVPHIYGLDLRDFVALERFDNVWLKPKGVEELAEHITLGVMLLKRTAGLAL